MKRTLDNVSFYRYRAVFGGILCVDGDDMYSGLLCTDKAWGFV